MTEEVAAPSALAALLDAQPDEIKARYASRNPKETLEFFGIQPGMTVLEGLPGRGWYTRMLLQYLGSEGTVLAANYSLDMYPLFSFMDEERLAEQAAWAASWAEFTDGWGGDDGAATAAFHFGGMPEEFAGTADVVFFPRVLHNLARFQTAGDGAFLDAALADAFAALKPGGVFGVVQHRAPDDKTDEWADGSRGYLKESFVIEAIEAAGFEFVGSIDVNLNPNDQPGENDIVWRLPPSLSTSGDDEQLRDEMRAIGESSRMTLKFVKPAS
ncbi:MAG: methyltransferase [Pseudomonadota bacterium]